MTRVKGKPMDYLERKPGAILERQSVSGKTKGKSVREVLRWSLKLSFGLLLVSMLSFGLYWMRDRLYHSPRFDVAITEINGLQNISQNQVLVKISELQQPGRNLMRLDLDRLRRSLELIPWVKTVVVRRVLPDKADDRHRRAGTGCLCPGGPRNPADRRGGHPAGKQSGEPVTARFSRHSGNGIRLRPGGSAAQPAADRPLSAADAFLEPGRVPA